MTLAGAGYELIGVTVAGPAPLGRLYLPLDEGCTALYGLNGAGKTRLLRAVSAALSGEAGAGSAALHVRVTGDLGDHAFVDALGTALAGEVLRHRTGLADLPAGTAPVPPGSTIRRLVTDLLSAALARHGEDADQWGHLLAEIAAAGRFLLRPVGSPGAPAWAVFVAGERVPQSAVDAACAEQELLEQQVASAADDVTVEQLLGQHTGFPVAFAAVLHEVLGQFREAAHAGPDDRSVRPSWLSWAVLAAGTVRERPAVVVGDPVASQLDARTREVLFGQPGPGNPLVRAFVEHDVELDGDVASRAADLATEANQALAQLFGDSLEVRFEWRHPDDWVRGRLPAWQALDQSDAWVALDQLSTAQRRWAEASVHFALRRHEPGTPIVLALDEPETGLHRRAEQRVADGLGVLGRSPSASVLVATHSPTFLSQLDTAVVRVFRNDRGRTRIANLDATRRRDLGSSLDDLGLSGPDLFQLTRVFVVVEGEHDVIVFENAIGRELADARSHLLRLRGAKQATTLLEASLLFDFSDAPIVLVLDNLGHESISPIWHRATTLARAGHTKEALGTLSQLRHLDGGESKWLLDLGSRAVEQGQIGRIDVFGMSEPDVICYLPAASLVPGASSWAPLVREWRASARGQAHDLKAWLADRYGVHVSISILKRAAAEARRAKVPIPGELTQLAHRIEALASARRDTAHRSGG